MIEIRVDNPYYDRTYLANMSLELWKNDLENMIDGHIGFIHFRDEYSNQYMTINPSNFASVQVKEVAE